MTLRGGSLSSMHASAVDSRRPPEKVQLEHKATFMPALTEKQFGAGQQRWVSLDSSMAASGLNALTTGG